MLTKTKFGSTSFLATAWLTDDAPRFPALLCLQRKMPNFFFPPPPFLDMNHLLIIITTKQIIQSSLHFVIMTDFVLSPLTLSLYYQSSTYLMSWFFFMIAQTIEFPTMSTMMSMEYIAIMATRADSDMSEGCQWQ